jgi:hypothetical protein
MGVSGGPNAIQDGLVLVLDASDRNSYASGSTIWYDLSGNGNNFTLQNSPALTGSYLYFNGINQKADCVNSTFGNFGTGSFTLEYVLFTNGSGSNGFAAVIMKRWAVTNIGGASGFVDRIFANIFYTQDSNPGGNRANVLEINYTTPRNVNNHIVQVINKDSTGLIASGSTYINSSLFASANRTYIGDGSVNNGNTVRLMWSEGENGYLSGNLYSVRAYNRALTPAEIRQNYNAQKTRLGLK